MTWFRNWLKALIIEALAEPQQEFETQLAALHEVVRNIRADQSNYIWPRLTLDAIQAWDAVSYACEKIYRDEQFMRLSDKTVQSEEIWRWVRNYAGANHTTEPSFEDMLSLIGIWEYLREHRTIGKYPLSSQ